ncbi:CG3368 [Drosophila busckii]|uniref:CG3368 n=1 Tax=Drosophila busckii TaxID=30019 RepID=A0A0M4EDF4_DROBS|nr:uncharacterized protein LOC108604631 [Drosophila busckii]ALC45816.1 CG3368 [Drosophila busckii]
MMAAATSAAQITTQKHSDCLSYLQSLGDATPTEVITKLAGQINEEACKAEIDQAALNVNFRVYYHIVQKYEVIDAHFAELSKQLSWQKPEGYQMLQSVLLTNHWKQLNAELIERNCIAGIIAALEHNSLSLLHQLKALNLLVKKFPKLQLLELQLEHFYHCLQRQSQVGTREETLTLFNHTCKQRERALRYSCHIVKFWPWTNRNKYYLLSGILNSHSLADLLEASSYSEQEFMSGLRLSLSYKGLRAASQYPIKSLSNQQSTSLLELAVELLLNGTIAEIQNFYSQWFLRIQQRDKLFQLLQTKPEIMEFLASTESTLSTSAQLRLILIFSMFAKEIYVVSKLHFFKISTELLTNCSSFATDSQLLVFKFLVDNLSYFAVEDCLDFFYNFIERHRGVESSEFRNTMLGKLPNIINHTAKHFDKALKANSSALGADIKRFFGQLQQLIEQDLQSVVYQPRIFALKLLDILHNSLYSARISKNAKMCSMQQNQQLGGFLLQQGVYQQQELAQKLFNSLNEPQGFDDALELTVVLLLQLNQVDNKQCIERCQALCASSDVDECALVTLYAQLTVSSFAKPETAQEVYEVSLAHLNTKVSSFEQDALRTVKGGQLFGHLCMIDALISSNQREFKFCHKQLLMLLERILKIILHLLNLANVRRNMPTAAASFQDMDESLHLLIAESAYEATEAESPETLRKYLLMSFWLSLKACCDLATSVGCALLAQQDDYDALQRCLDIQVAVLTRCRHKGAIEAAGLSIGKLTRAISSQDSFKCGFELLYNCLERELLSDKCQVSTTRRGAGFSIMFLHVLKNDNPRQRLLLHKCVKNILERLQQSYNNVESTDSSNVDRWEALALHYLCVLVRDTELRPAMCVYYNDIMLRAMEHIEHKEWTIANAALQLFGACLGKLVGQRQATEFDTKLAWEPSELDYEQLTALLPKTCEHMLNCCETQQQNSSLILFLAFLSKVEYLCTTRQAQRSTPLLHRFRRLSWHLLRHNGEQVRLLAASCFVRAHEFRCELPAVLISSAKLSTQLEEDNFYEGLLYTLHAGVLKLQHEARHVWTVAQLKHYQQRLLAALQITKQLTRFHSYTLNVLLQLLELLDGDEQAQLVRQILDKRRQQAIS